MPMDITSWAATWFLPFVLPICLWVMWNDLRVMRIPNKLVLALAGVFLVVGLIAMPSWQDYGMGLVAMFVMLIVGMVANAAGLMGAGDSKFIAAAAPFIALGDLRFLLFLFSANILACVVTHRMTKATPLRQMAPEWVSWDRGKKFPMGFSLGATLVIYLIFGILRGA